MPDRKYLNMLGFKPAILESIGATAVLASGVEFWVERTIWKIKNENPSGVVPSTDGKSIGALIRTLDDLAKDMPSGNLKDALQIWTVTARSAFNSRNTIFHGMAIPFNALGGKGITFFKNTSWSKESRSRERASFLADNHTLKLLREVFVTLVQTISFINLIVDDNVNGDDVAKDLIPSLRRVRSIAVEIEDLPAAVNHEKY